MSYLHVSRHTVHPCSNSTNVGCLKTNVGAFPNPETNFWGSHLTFVGSVLSFPAGSRSAQTANLSSRALFIQVSRSALASFVKQFEYLDIEEKVNYLVVLACCQGWPSTQVCCAPSRHHLWMPTDWPLSHSGADTHSVSSLSLAYHAR